MFQKQRSEKFTKPRGRNLLLEFSVLSFIAFLVIGYVVVGAIQPALEDFVVKDQKGETVIFVNKYVNQLLLVSDFDFPLDADQENRMSEFVSSLSIRGIVSIFVTDSAGTIIYAEPKRFIGGSLADNRYVKEALEKRIANSDIKEVKKSEQEILGVKEVLVQTIPVTFSGSNNVVGTVYVISRLGLLKTQIRESERDMIVRTVLGLSFLYSLLFVIVWRASRTIRKQAYTLTSYAKTLEDRVHSRTKDLRSVNKDLNAAVKKLVVQNIELDRLSKAKAQFLANMSHELRTPLSGILGFAEYLYDEEEGKLNKNQKEQLSLIMKSGQHLLQLINEVLDISKVEAGKMYVSAEKFFAPTLIKEVIPLVSRIIEKKKIALTLDIDKGVSDIYTDRVKFKQCVLNLVNNAVKFTDKGSVTVKVRVVGPNIVVDVKDTGIGIKKEFFKELFKEFSQAENARTKKYRGTGLGLTITKKFAILLGGDVTVKSTVGKGSTFTLTIPVKFQEKGIDK